MSKCVYLDYNATAPLLPEVKEAMVRAMDMIGNPASVHQLGRKCRAEIDKARKQVAATVDVSAKDVTFTSGGTESNHLALTGLLAELPDLVVSGINEGANLGDDILYSGTVAAAIEGRFLGLPSIAISLASRECHYYETAGQVVKSIVKGLIKEKLPLGVSTILNVNVPDLPEHLLQGITVTRLGTRHVAEPVIREKDPRGHDIYWIGPPGGEADAGPGSDFYAVNNGKVSVTPLMIDFTHHAVMNDIGDWLMKIEQKDLQA